MRAEKKLWLYRGLTVPEGVAFVRRGLSPRSAANCRVLLLGGIVAQALAPLMNELSVCSSASLHVDVEPTWSAREWVKSDRFRSHLAVFRPTTCVFVLDPSDMLARRCVRARLGRIGTADLWMVPYGIECPPSTRFIPADEANVGAYAVWAARTWAMVE